MNRFLWIACEMLVIYYAKYNVSVMYFSATRNVSYPVGKVHIGWARIQMKFAGVFAMDSAFLDGLHRKCGQETL